MTALDTGLVTGAGTNWSGTVAYSAREVRAPRQLDELREVVRTAVRVRALGSRHSFSTAADTDGTLVSLDRMPGGVEVDPVARTVRVPAQTRYADLARLLQARGWALGNLASLPHISVAGSVATGTHGSGDRNQALSAAVTALDVVTADGELRRITGEDLDAWVVAVGSLGIVVSLELRIEPTYDVVQRVHPRVGWEVVTDRFDELTSCAYSVSLFTRFERDVAGQVWTKARTEGPDGARDLGLLPADGPLHMLSGGDGASVTDQSGAPGAWSDRLPHFRHDHVPSRGAEVQSEYFVPRERALEALDVLRRLRPGHDGLLQVAEVRTVAADSSWLSGAHGRDVVGLHFTWARDEAAVRALLPRLEEQLVPLGARPHWGKVFTMGPDAVAAAFPRYADFVDLRESVDPDRRFVNDLTDRYLSMP